MVLPRTHVMIPKRPLSEADTATLTLTADNMISRNREIIIRNPYLAVALARIAAQLTYRLASERYRDAGDSIELVIELTRDEHKALVKYARQILFNIDTHIHYYKNLLRDGKAKNRTAIEARIAALEVWHDIIEQLVEEEQ